MATDQVFTDPVTLSAGPLGGQIVEGGGWAVGVTRTFDGLNYRRTDQDGNPESVDQAVHEGNAG